MDPVELDQSFPTVTSHCNGITLYSKHAFQNFAIGLTVVTGLGRTVSAFLPISGATTDGDWFIGSFANSGTPGTITCTAFRPFGNFAAGTNNYSFNWIAIG